MSNADIFNFLSQRLTYYHVYASEQGPLIFCMGPRDRDTFGCFYLIIILIAILLFIISMIWIATVDGNYPNINVWNEVTTFQWNEKQAIFDVNIGFLLFVIVASCWATICCGGICYGMFRRTTICFNFVDNGIKECLCWSPFFLYNFFTMIFCPDFDWCQDRSDFQDGILQPIPRESYGDSYGYKYANKEEMVETGSMKF